MKTWINKDKVTFNVAVKVNKYKNEEVLKRQLIVLGDYIEKRFNLEPFGVVLQANQINDDFVKSKITLHLEYEL
jgi:hypothetical protein